MRYWSKKSAKNVAKCVAIRLVMEKRCENKVEMCHFLGCNGSIIRHYVSRLINVEEPEKSLKGWGLMQAGRPTITTAPKIAKLDCFVVWDRS
ncbi:hypothetical protein P8452_58949 [Trifolium repens]|nr:hypothetical protein P8452_58949 [Trifolium repens]